MEAQSSLSSSGYLVQQNSREAKDIIHMKQSDITLHTIRKPRIKPWRKPTAPLPPAATRVYKVDRMDFREVVQKLTGAPEFQSQPRQFRQRAAVPPLELAKPKLTTGINNTVLHDQVFIPTISNSMFTDMSQDLMSESVDTKTQRDTDDAMVQSFFGMNSPSSMYNWAHLLSPRSLLSHLQ